jgi:molybdate transport system permease protein
MKFKHLAIAAAFSVLFIYGGIFLSVFYFFDGRAMLSSLGDERVLFTIRNSVYAATLATLLATAIAVPAAYAISRFDFPFKSWIDLSLEFPMIISPAALGAMLLIFFQTPAGSFIREHLMEFVFVFAGIVLAQFVTIIGLATRLIKAVMDEIPLRYEQVARTLGATHRQAFFTITLPLAKKGIASALILTWAKAVGEFGATIMLAGSMAMKTETLPVAIFMRLSIADIKGTVGFILILFTISISILAITRQLFAFRR